MVNQFLFGTERIESLAANIGLLLLRIIAGLSMSFAHGLEKMPPTENFVASVGEMGFPAPLLFSWMAGISEFIGGLFIFIGFLTRPSALFLGITMSVAAFVQHSADPFANQEKAILYLGFCILLIFTGSGKYGADGVLKN